jgi:phenylacetate-CoA ligase
MIWNKQEECLSAEDKKAIQSKRLVSLVDYVYHNVPYYRAKMQQVGLLPCDIQSVDDITKLPFTTKQDLRDNYPYGLFAVPLSQIVRIHASSGMTGHPTVVGYTRRDIANWQDLTARCLSAYGATKDDIFSIGYGYGLFTGGLGLHYGVEHLGGTVIPMSTGNTDKHIQLLRDFGATVIACTPSYALYLYETIRQKGLSKDDFKLRIGVFGAEPWTEAMRNEIEEKLGIKAYNIYGLSEIMGPGVSHECEFKCGSHIADDHFYPEIIDPLTLTNQPYGQSGELVLTTLQKEGIPLIRYRTKDLCSLMDGTCECGRTTVRMSRIVGRSDDMLIIRGVNVFPSQIESVILETKTFDPHFLIVVDRVNNTDTMEIDVEVREEFYTDEINRLNELKEQLNRRIQSVLGISAKIKLVEPYSIERTAGKAKRVIDHRNFN